MSDPLASLPGYSLRRASTAMTAMLAGRLAPFKLRPAEATVLLLIEESPQITASAVGRALDIQRANMVPLLKRLEDGGWIERAPIDGKSQGLSLAPASAARMKEVRATVARLESELIERVPAQHREHFLPALDALWR